MSQENTAIGNAPKGPIYSIQVRSAEFDFDANRAAVVLESGETLSIPIEALVGIERHASAHRSAPVLAG